MQVILIILAVVTSLAAPAERAHADDRERSFYIPNLFLTGYDYRQSGEAIRDGYVMGLFDGFLASPIFGGSQNALQKLNSCVGNTNSTELRAMFDRYIDNHPEQWNLAAGAVFYNLFNSACPYLKK
jgi:hypothetical protein